MAEAVPVMNTNDAPQQHKRVLIIDDSPMIVELIRSVVTMNGDYDALVAYDGVSGLEVFYKERPDCVIVDVRMPRMDGFQVARCIRGDITSAQTPLIILSAMNEEADHQTGLFSGVDEYLAKPFKASALCATLERVMNITPEERTNRIELLAAADFAYDLIGVEDDADDLETAESSESK